MNVGDTVKLHGVDHLGRDVSGMTARVRDVGAIYAVVSVLAWGGESITVLRFDCQPHDPTPMSAQQFRDIHLTWQERNRRVIRRMHERRAA